MFRRIGFRLALLNAIVVVGVIAVTGLATYALLQRALDREEQRSIQDRVERAALDWTPLMTGAATPTATATATRDTSAGGDGEEEGEDGGQEDSEDDELLETGDTFLFAFDRSGKLLVNERGIAVQGLPDMGAVHAALDGGTTSSRQRAGDRDVRVWTEPVRANGRIVGAVQGVRGTGEHESQRRQVLLFTGLGVLLGTIVAVPAGLFLSHRAMRPIEAAFTRQRAFVSDASHELRTPLTLIRAQAELIERLSGQGSDIADEAEVVSDEVDRMNRLVGDLLLLARMDEQPERAADAVDLSALLTETVASFERPAEAAGVALSAEIGPQLRVTGEAEALRQVARNLIDNALRYTPKGGRVAVVTERHGDHAIVRVRDTGIGIPPEEHDRVFDRFYRTDRARARTSGGTGLGLPIARAIVHAHGGRTGVESTQGAGSTFWFSLPLAGD